MNEILEMIQNYAASGKYKRVPVSRELYADAFTPISVMRTLRAASRHCYLLESAEDRQQWGRYSFLGYAPTMEITCMDGKVVILEGNEEDEKIKREVRTDHPGKILREILKDYKSPVVPGLPPFTGGLVGYFSYDYIKYGEPSLKPILNGASENDFRDADLMLFDRVIVFDNYRQKLILITGVRLDGDLEENYENAQRELEEMERLIRSGAKAVFKPLKLEEEFQPGAEKAEYCRMVEKAKEYIREGDIFQVVLSNPLTAKAKGSLFDTYRVLRTSNPSPYMFYFSSDDIEVAGASPETLAKLENGTVCTFPLAGTRPRGKTEEEDQRLERELLADEKELAEFTDLLASLLRLPTNFVRDVIMKASGKDIMNSMTRSVLTLGSYDDTLNDTSLSNVLRQCLMLISEFPMLAVYGYRAYSHYERNKSLYIHRPDMSLSTAENIIRMLRPDKKFTKLEALVLDIALVLHMEHGGGNNSTFTTRVVTSSGSDTYSVMAAALCSLKGPKHGGANIKVQQMMKDLKKHVKDTSDVDEIVFYLSQLLNKEAFDKKGLIYGMGHAVYSVSDPRAQIFKGFVKDLAEEKGLMDDYQLYSNVEQLAVDLISKRRTIYKGVCANVDFYSGFVYSMLGIPEELFTPLFAMARIVGWSAHRMEELITGDKIIRPAYKPLSTQKEYIE